MVLPHFALLLITLLKYNFSKMVLLCVQEGWGLRWDVEMGEEDCD